MTLIKLITLLLSCFSYLVHGVLPHFLVSFGLILHEKLPMMIRVLLSALRLSHALYLLSGIFQIFFSTPCHLISRNPTILIFILLISFFMLPIFLFCSVVPKHHVLIGVFFFFFFFFGFFFFFFFI